MLFTRSKAAGVVVLAGATAVSLAASPATASPAKSQSSAQQLHVVKTLSSAFIGPLQFEVAGKKVIVADSFTSTLSLIGRSTPLATNPGEGNDIAGVAVNARTGALAYTTSNADHSTTTLQIVRPGRKTIVADLSGFERRRNPDRNIGYGVDKPSQCVTDALNAAEFPVKYTGITDSHPYAVAALGNGAWAVADAGGNDILKVDRHGNVSVLSVLPRQPLKITADFAASLGLPDCVIGVTYNFEAVPTDVEVGRHGALYVTTLPGGPEGPGVGARGSVYKIGWNGKAKRVATGFSGATNLAVTPRGSIYVAELSAGTVSKVVCGEPASVLSLAGVVAIEYANGHLYASTAPVVLQGGGPDAPPPTGPPPAGTVVLLGR